MSSRGRSEGREMMELRKRGERVRREEGVRGERRKSGE